MYTNQLLGKASLNKRIRLGLGSSLVILIIASAVSYLSIRKLIDQTYWVDHTNQVLYSLERVTSLVKDVETSERGYMLTNDKDFLDLYNQSFKEILPQLEEVKTLTADNQAQQQHETILEALLIEKLEHLDNVLNTYKKDGTVAVDEMVAARKIMQKIRQEVDIMKNEENRLLRIRTEEAESYYSITPVHILILSLFAVVVSAVSFIFISRDIKNKELTQEEMASLKKRLIDSNYKLERIKQQLDNQNYILKGATKLNELLRAEKDLEITADKVVAHLCEYTHAQSGIFYLKTEDANFHYQSGYAVEKEKLKKMFSLGEGIMGQAALEQKIYLLDKIPSDTLKINSGFSSIEPVELLVVPFYSNGETIAVVELLNKNKFADTTREYILSLGDLVTTTINRIKAENKTAELLAESQALTEELESQQEELKQINGELQASEEELKVSQEELQEKNSELEEKAQLLEDQYE